MSIASSDDTERTNVCDRCDDEYESYEVYLKKSEISSFKNTDWDNLCKPCRMAVTDYGAYLTESEREELEPKQEP